MSDQKIVNMRRGILIVTAVVTFYACGNKKNANLSEAGGVLTKEKHRPEFHFTPDSMWMNDPNGLVFHQNIYHLFYQYYPDSTVWGPMHWGHATSTNMIEWQHEPVALYPDALGYIFSGSAVVDKNNTTGFGTADNPPLVAIFTYHDPVAAEQNPSMSQSQGIAYSLDNGDSWEKYDNNPVLKSPGINDFRDPKVRWFEAGEKWIMTLAVKNHIRFYSSPDLKNWKLESEFGEELGAHGGVWECPDLFPLAVEGSEEKFWILIVSLNPGGPNGGSGTQYFVGQFDGKSFTPVDPKIRWIDYGPDDYAGVTWSNTASRTIFLGWMSNWKYATRVPTEKWRSAMTIPRELKLLNLQDDWVVSSTPVPEFEVLDTKKYDIPEFVISGDLKLSEEIGFHAATLEMDMELQASHDFEIAFSNAVSDQVLIGYSKSDNKFYIDRSGSGDTSFHPEFAQLIEAPRFSDSEEMSLKLVVDVASVELFADDGTTVMTAIYFPEEVLDQISLRSEGPVEVRTLVLKEI